MEQVIFGGISSPVDITTTKYNSLFSGYAWGTDVKFIASAVSTPGKLKALRIKLDGVPGTGTYTFTLRRRVGTGAWANTALTCTVAAGDTIASDLVNEVSVAAGDIVILECNPDAPDNARSVTWTLVFEGDNANESLIMSVGRGFTTLTMYTALGTSYSSTTTEDNARRVCPTSGIIKNLYVQLDTDPGISPDAYKFTLRIANAGNSYVLTDTALTVTITADGTTGNDTANDITVAAGDFFTIKVEPLNTPDVLVYAAIGICFVADTDGESLLFGGAYDDLNDTATEYNELIPAYAGSWGATESFKYQLAQACTLKKLYMLLSGSPGAGKDYTFTVRIAGASSNVVVTIADAATTGNSGALEDTVVDDNYVSLQIVPTGTPTVRNVYWGLVGFIAPVVGLENKSSNMAAKMMARGMI